MQTEELVRKLESLAQLDTDAVQVYSEALAHVHEDDVREAYTRFQGEHRYHASTLSDAIVRLGGKKPELKVDLMGRVADWVTSFRSMLGKEGALHAMKTAERYHNSRYADAAAWDLDDSDLAAILARFYGDEKRHLAFIDERLHAHAPAGGSTA